MSPSGDDQGGNMAVIMIDDVPGASHEMIEGLRQAGVVDKLKATPGFKGHWSGPTGSGYRVIECGKARMTGGPGTTARSTRTCRLRVEAAEPTFIDLAEVIEPS